MRQFIKFLTILSAAIIMVAACEEQKPEPIITVTTSDGQIVAQSAAGEYSFNYEITNPVKGGVVSVEIPETCTWITKPVIDTDAKKVTLTLLENTVKETRTELVTVAYTYDGKKISTVASVLQEAGAYDYMVNCTYGKSSYLGNLASENENLTYSMIEISNKPLDNYYDESYYYILDLCSGATEDKLPKPGTYTFSYDEADGVFGSSGMAGYGEWIGDLDKANEGDPNEYKEFVFEDGTIVVEREGKVYTIKATIEDADGKIHFIQFNGELELEDLTADVPGEENESELTFNGKTLSNYMAMAYFYGDYYEVGMDNYYIMIAPGSYFTTNSINAGDVLTQLDLLVPVGAKLEEGFTSIDFGVYKETTAASEYVFLPGYAQEGQAFCSWIFQVNETVTAYSIQAAVSGGTITIADNGDGTINLSSKAVDHEGTAINLTGTNIPIAFYDASEASQASVKGVKSIAAESRFGRKSLR